MFSLFHLIFITLVSLSSAFELGLISSYKREEVPALAYQKSVWFFYKTDCQVCHRQVAELKCINKPINIVAAGFGATRMKLWRESKKLKLDSIKPLRSYVLDDKAFNKIALKKGLSPQLILFENEKVIKHFIGFTSCKKLLKEFSISKRKS